jgi:hypothetical protein
MKGATGASMKFYSSLLLAAAVIVFSVMPTSAFDLADMSARPSPFPVQSDVSQSTVPDVLAQFLISDACCKHCSTGYACGNSCISRSKQCHKGRGCACD